MGVKVRFTSLINFISRSSVQWVDGEGVQFIGEKAVSSKIARNLIRLLYPLYAILFLSNLRIRQFQRDVSFLWTPKGLFTDLYALIYLKVILQKRIVCEKNELNRAIKLNVKVKNKGNPIQTVFSAIYLLTASLQDELVRYFDHVIVISTRMYDWANKRNNRVSLVPILVDPEEAHNADTDPLDLKVGPLKIGFFGTLDNHKEGLLDFINVLARFSGKYDYRLDVYGLAKQEERTRIMSIVCNLKISKKVIIHDFLPGEIARQKMRECEVLILPRKSNLQNEYGFSTKLGEYLISGAAVLITDVSDNARYIKDKVNGIIYPAGDVTALESALSYAFAFRESLSRIAKQGQLLALEQFSYKKHAHIIYSSITGFGAV